MEAWRIIYRSSYITCMERKETTNKERIEEGVMDSNNEDCQMPKTTTRRALLFLNCIFLCVGSCGGPLITRLYFIHGGSRVWFSSWLQTCAWPIMFIPILISHLRGSVTSKFVPIKPFLFLAATGVGILLGFSSFFYSKGVSGLPVSTSSLIMATELAFTAGFAFLLLRQKFTSHSINAVVLLTVGAVTLALHTNGDRPENESKKAYTVSFLMIAGSAIVSGFILPLVELIYTKSKQEISYTVVMEIQMIICFSATVFCTIGMLVNNDFKVIPGEAREFGLGETKYYVIVVFSSIMWQCMLLGIIGVVFCSSSLSSGIIVSILFPVTEILAVIFYKEKFQPEKGVALALSLWGCISYFYGEYKHSKKRNVTAQTEIPMQNV